MFQVAKVVDHGVAAKDGGNPPKENGGASFRRLSNGHGDGDVKDDLSQCRHLKVAHDSTFLAVRPVFHGPSSSTVVHGDAHGRKDDSSGAALESVERIRESKNVPFSACRKVAETWILQGLAIVEGCEFRITINVVGEGMVL